MQCVVYKCAARADYYLFVEREDDFKRLPDALLGMLGVLEKVMDLELYEGRKLAQAEAADVIKQLIEQGYYLQMPTGEPHPLDA